MLPGPLSKGSLHFDNFRRPVSARGTSRSGLFVQDFKCSTKSACGVYLSVSFLFQADDGRICSKCAAGNMN